MASNKMEWKRAIDASIKKWERIAIEEKRGKQSCALCDTLRKLHGPGNESANCSGCPLGEAQNVGCGEGLWQFTSNGYSANMPGCDNDYEFLLALYMLKVIYPKVKE